MTQDVSLSRGEDKNSFAEANAYAENPIDLNNRAVAVRTEASSSTIEITGTSATRSSLCSRARASKGPDGVASCKDRVGLADGELYLGFEKTSVVDQFRLQHGERRTAGGFPVDTRLAVFLEV
jgi:hypothetical protein